MLEHTRSAGSLRTAGMHALNQHRSPPAATLVLPSLSPAAGSDKAEQQPPCPESRGCCCGSKMLPQPPGGGRWGPPLPRSVLPAGCRTCCCHAGRPGPAQCGAPLRQRHGGCHLQQVPREGLACLLGPISLQGTHGLRQTNIISEPSRGIEQDNSINEESLEAKSCVKQA